MKKIDIQNIIEGTVFSNEPLKNHTTYRIGGLADFFIYPKDKKDISKLIKYFNSIKYPYFILGNGSNVLASDDGYRGAIINTKKTFTKILVHQNEILCESGAMLSAVAKVAMDKNLSGFEELAGVPGTIGGAIMMNAGCYGRSISDKLKMVEIIDENGNIIKLKASEISFGYRKCSLKGIVTKAIFNLSMENPLKIEKLTNDLLLKRKKSQPLSLPSCGSVFKRPEGYFAGKLIQDALLKGKVVGGAMVSKKHAGFIINYDKATAEEVKELIQLIQKKVKEKFDVMLEKEVIYL